MPNSSIGTLFTYHGTQPLSRPELGKKQKTELPISSAVLMGITSQSTQKEWMFPSLSTVMGSAREYHGDISVKSPLLWTLKTASAVRWWWYSNFLNVLMAYSGVDLTAHSSSIRMVDPSSPRLGLGTSSPRYLPKQWLKISHAISKICVVLKFGSPLFLTVFEAFNFFSTCFLKLPQLWTKNFLYISAIMSIV